MTLPRSRLESVTTIAVALALPLLPGCTHVIAYDSPYFKHGPAQLEPPDGTLAAGTKVWVFNRRDSYRRVWSSGFVNAYVLDSSVVPITRWWEMERQRKDAEDAPKTPEGDVMKLIKEDKPKKQPRYKPK